MTKTDIWLVLVTLLLVLFCVCFKSWIRSASLALRLPGPPALPLIGNALLVTNSIKLVYLGRVCYEKYGRIFRAWLSIIPAIFVLEPSDIQIILASNKHNDKNFVYSLMHNFIGEGLISTNGNYWKTHRKLIQPHFHINVLQFYVSSFSRSAKQQVEKLKNREDVDITSFVNHCVLDILHETVLGIPLEDSKLKEESPFRKGQITVPIRLKKPWFLFDCIYKLTSIAQIEFKQKSSLHEFTRKILEMRRKDPPNGKMCHKSLIEYFMEISENHPDFTDDDIVNETCTFMLAGQDSVGAAVAFALYFLAKHEDIQKKILEELENIFEKPDRVADLNDLNSMRYLEQCIKETLRLYPSIPMFARKLSEDVHLEKHTLPAGCNVFVSPYATHRLAHVYKNPEKFDPDRFSVQNMEKLHPYAYIPFSAGPRNCIGFKFALLEIKSILSTILRAYHISLCPEREFSLFYRITLRAKGGIWLRLKPRSTN